MPPFTDVEILALLRTPCNTPRSVSFALPNDNDHSGPTNCARRPSAPPRSPNVYYVNEEDPALPTDDSKRDVFNGKEDAGSVIGFMDVEDMAVSEAARAPIADNDDLTDELSNRSAVNDDSSDTLPSWETKKASFVLGSEAGSNQSSSRQSSFRHSAVSTLSGDDNDEPPLCPAICSHSSGDDLALIHILHIDDAPEDPAGASQCAVVCEASPVAITRF